MNIKGIIPRNGNADTNRMKDEEKFIKPFKKHVNSFLYPKNAKLTEKREGI